MKTPKYPIDLSETYVHYNSLIWQVPSWGIAISAGVIVAANQIGDCKNWIIPTNWVQAIILLFGALLLTALSIALYKYRLIQAAIVPYPIPLPLGKKPAANAFLQLAICLTSGGLFGLAIAQALSMPIFIFIGFIVGFIAWILFERGNKIIVKEINELIESSNNEVNNKI